MNFQFKIVPTTGVCPPMEEAGTRIVLTFDFTDFMTFNS